MEPWCLTQKSRAVSPVVIRLSDEERTSGQTRSDTIQQALTHYHRDGFFVLENAIADDLIDAVYNRMVEDNETYLAKPHMYVAES